MNCGVIALPERPYRYRGSTLGHDKFILTKSRHIVCFEHYVDVVFLCYCHGAVSIVVIKRRLHYTQVPAMSIVGIIHMDAMQGKKGICFAQEKLILVVKRFFKVLTNKTRHYKCRIDFND